ncbi:tRNA (adenosine(37)-N6)-threonylcarbamoyltransferase complex dimerization subunit type 1 TsaB [candidate division WOR-3 bacterium RBG_13_43_14]|uniref:tRNA (Adenosine(37)-N6)-threonylcarbamoyltransferase complex dimerization subunit type 1 TsaB n=1 Tax=candidate division WOR-3 bacterium RBG_13_43_14 TaxID=1802590 RepID=A0A1F4U2C5_UNCW3|nr:MAG: tRNA (adenosine(37)-N6)-threonylcarbamoyltransferase complex dimerization subunit type 1 TsaB [candidate division WOR-3 bacterium RBG_13_43_14]
MKIIGIETSSPVFSIALADDNTMIFEIRRGRRIFGPNRDAGLFDDVRDMLKHYEQSQISAIAISIGPGLFTSLRVGLSLAKGLAISWKKPVVAVNTLDLLGTASSVIPGPLMAVIDAHHNELYAASYKAGSRISDYRLITPEALINTLSGKWTAIGSGSALLAKYHFEGVDINYIESESFLPNAAKVIEIARPRIEQQQYERIDDLEPFYLKRTDAERNRNKTNEI